MTHFVLIARPVFYAPTRVTSVYLSASDRSSTSTSVHCMRKSLYRHRYLGGMFNVHATSHVPADTQEVAPRSARPVRIDMHSSRDNGENPAQAPKKTP